MGQELQLINIAESIAKDYNVDVNHEEWPYIYQKVDGGSVVFDSTRFDSEFFMEYENLM